MSKAIEEANLDNIPDAVKDVESYKKYLELDTELNNREGRYHQTSDPGIIVDLCTTPHILKKKLSHLPIEEVDGIIELTHPWRSLLGQMAAAKRQAFGHLTRQEDDSHLGVIEAKQAELIEYFGKFYTIEEVFKIVTVDWGFPVAITNLKLFYKKHIEKIKELQEEYKQKVNDIRLHHKRARLDELQLMFNRRKQKYQEDESIANEKQLQSLIESIKKEVEGDLVVQGKLQVEIEEKINIQVEQQLLKDFNVTVVVISKIAGKLGINPLFLLSRLAHSRYAKFAGFGTEDDIEEAQIVYPSSLSYDMGALAKLAKVIEKEEQQMKSLPKVVETETVTSLKRKLLDELKSKEKLIIGSVQNVENNSFTEDKE